MNNNKISFSFTSYQPISENGKKKYSVGQSSKKIGYHGYLKNTIIGCLTVVIDRRNRRIQNAKYCSSHDMGFYVLIMKDHLALDLMKI